VFFLDAESDHGSVRSDVRMKRNASGGSRDGAPTVRLRARSGSIYISPR
jgi:hypothetical protein